MKNQDKLGILFDQIQLPDEYRKEFDGGELMRIIGNQGHDVYHFVIQLPHLVKPYTYFTLKEHLHMGFPTFRKTMITLQVPEIAIEPLKDYYRYFMEEYAKENPSLSFFVDKKITLNDSIVTIEVGNLAEKMKFQSLQERFMSDLKSAGFGELALSIVINPEGEKQIHDEIMNDLKEATQEVRKTPVVDAKPVSNPIPEKKVFKGNYQRKSRVPKDNDEEVILGRKIDTEVMTINNIMGPQNNVTLEVYIFDDEVRETKTGLKIVTLKLTDYTDSIYGKMFINDDDEYAIVKKNLKKGSWVKLRGTVKDDAYSKELVFNIYDVNHLDKVIEEVIDDALEKRVELHAHTMMSQMDGVVNEVALVKQAIKWGHKAIAITDHNGCQAFPHVYQEVTKYNKGKEEKDQFKALYGSELTLIDDTVNIVVRPTDDIMLDQTYVVFDFETTGFNAGGKDSIIEIGAVKIHNGEILERYDELINPGRKLPSKIVEITNITDEMLADKDNEENG